MNAVASGYDVQIPLLIEVDVGLQRAGVAPGEAVVELAKAIDAAPHLHFAGLMSWEGHTAPIKNQSEKERAVRDAVGMIVHSAALCKQAGLAVEIVSCGGTGTYPITSHIDGVTELQAGGGIFGDVRYRDEYGIQHDCALTIWTTVISRPRPNRIVCDAGWKAMARFPTLPEPVGLGLIEQIRMSAEHTTLDLKQPAIQPRVGDRLQFIVGYSDSTVFLHDSIYGTRNGSIEMEWPLLARGKLR
jgi:D-serine deaminase-like pyridoxal phosphate-dependent protein